MVKIYQQPFAHAGTKQAIPDASDPQGFVSNADGFTTDYELDDSDPNYKPIERAEFNGLMNMITEAVGEIQQFGFAKWQPITWPQGARVIEGGVVYRALTQTSQQPPHADWVDDMGGLVKLTGDQTVAGVKTFSSFPVTPSAAPIADYQVANKKYVDDSAGPLGIGVEQTWQDMAGNRTGHTWYTNSTGRPIQVACYTNVREMEFHVRPDAYSGSIILSSLYGSTNERSQLPFIIPPGWQYRLNADKSSSHFYWVELR